MTNKSLKPDKKNNLLAKKPPFTENRIWFIVISEKRFNQRLCIEIFSDNRQIKFEPFEKDA